MKESQLQKKILRYLSQLEGCECFKIISANKAGVADIVCCYRGKFVAIEVKVGSNKPTALQERFLERIKEAGGVAIVAYDLDDVKGLFDG